MGFRKMIVAFREVKIGDVLIHSDGDRTKIKDIEFLHGQLAVAKNSTRATIAVKVHLESRGSMIVALNQDANIAADLSLHS